MLAQWDFTPSFPCEVLQEGQSLMSGYFWFLFDSRWQVPSGHPNVAALFSGSGSYAVWIPRSLGFLAPLLEGVDRQRLTVVLLNRLSGSVLGA